MRQVYVVLFISLFTITAAFAGIPKDKDLLMWIGEGSGNKAVDGTGNGNDGTFHGNAKWVADGKFATGISLKGAETYMEVPDLITEAGSLLFWFKPDWDGKDGDDYRIYDASFGPIYFFISKGANHADINPEDFGFYFEAADDADWQDVEFDPAGVISKDKWFHVAATWDFDGGNPFLYIDGKEAATSGKKMAGGFPKLHEKPRFGWETIPYIPLQNGAEGVIDEISFWSRALDEGEVQEMMDTSLDVGAKGKLAVTWGELKVTR